MRARPDLVVNVVDVTNLERNLYLTVQILETEVPLLVVLNMQDLADATRRRRRLRQAVQACWPVRRCMTSAAARGHGLEELRDAIWALTRAAAPNQLPADLISPANMEAMVSSVVCHN